MYKLILVLSSMILFSGCAVMSKNECLNANWSVIGQRDGISGTGALLQAREQACAKHKVVMDRNLYTQSYKKGLKTYCNSEAVFDYALNGKGNYQSCPLEMQNELRPYYLVAHQYYEAKSKYDSVAKSIANAKGILAESDIKQKKRDRYRQILAENRELEPQVRRNLAEAERNLVKFKKAKNLN